MEITLTEKAITANSTLSQLRMTWLIEHFTSHQLLCKIEDLCSETRPNAKPETVSGHVLTTVQQSLEWKEKNRHTIFVRLKGGQSFILPKDKITDFDKVKVRLKELADHLKIKYINEEKWNWK